MAMARKVADMQTTALPPSDKWAEALSKDRLRGDYSRMRADYTIDQVWDQYTPAEHALYKRLYERQVQLLPKHACSEFIDGVAHLGNPDRIPRLDRISEKLTKATNWELVGVPGLIPDAAFFNHLAQRRLPVTTWLRKPEEFDYIVEPDVFHDFFGHVPLLFNPFFADYLQAYGQGGLKAHGLDALPFLARLYWYTVEFGLIRTAQGLRAYGSGILSSGGEIAHSVESDKPAREPFDLETVMCTEYRIDAYQDAYFVIESFEDLVAKTAPDFTPLYAKVRDRPVRVPRPASDRRVNRTSS
jgi:phenylalanine-4-hydroxylase